MDLLDLAETLRAPWTLVGGQMVLLHALEHGQVPPQISQDSDVVAPHLIDAELGNVLRKRTRAGEVTPTQAHTALRAAREVIDYRYPHVGALADLAWAWRDNLSFYDALYVALATRLDVPLITGDQRLSRAPGLPCPIELI